MSKVKVYGADWCPMTTRVRAFLDSRKVSYEYVDIDDNREAAKWVAEQNGGKEKKPTLDIDGEVLRVPGDHDVERALKAHGLTAA